MAIDVIQVNRIRTDSATVNLRSNVSLASCAATDYSVCYNNIWNQWCYWDNIFPTAPTDGTVLCIGCMRVGTDTVLRCGVCCAWTVPAGVTTAKFEVWGAGSGTHPGCCCSIQPFGMTGAYATICIPVTAGTVYTVCAGGAACCYPCQGVTGFAPGCSSYVLGTGLCCIRASGGDSCGWMGISKNIFGWNCLMGCYIAYMPNDRCFATGSYCSYNGAANTCGIMICSYAESCISSSRRTNEVIPIMPSYFKCTYSGHAILSTGEYRKAIGVPSLSSEICILQGSLCGYIKHPPIVGFANTSQCCVSWSSTQSTFGGCQCSPIAGINYLTAPGSGGNMVYTVGGCNSNYADAGRAGMVRITYC